MSGVFVAGTDTEVGKTYISCMILRHLNANKISAIGMKPIAAGSIETAEGARNEDALALIEASPASPDYATVNPCLFAQPTSPDIAARLSKKHISLAHLEAAHARCRASAEFVLVEGIGGWRVPLSDSLQTVDLVRAFDLPVILVCGIRLGCINHGLLSAESIIDDGIKLLGWVANIIDPNYSYLNESIDTMERRIAAPLLGVQPWQTPAAAIDERLVACLERQRLADR